MKRTQIYLDEEQDARLAREAQSAGRTKSDLIREAVDRYFDERLVRPDEWKQAFRDAFGAAPSLPADYVERLREADVRRQEELERRWRS